MSWNLFHSSTVVHRAVPYALLSSVSVAFLLTTAQAAIIGETIVTSIQYQPLMASIAVADIDIANFSASLADSTVYQKLGLTPNTSMSVNFVPDSATTGTIVINTTQPISTPFADVVLDIDSKGERKVVPKTLLMPLDNGLPVKSSNPILTTVDESSLLIVDKREAQLLTIKRGLPASLIAIPNLTVANNAIETVEAPMQTLLQNILMTSPLISTITTSIRPKAGVKSSIIQIDSLDDNIISTEQSINDINVLDRLKTTDIIVNTDDNVADSINDPTNKMASVLLTPAIDFSYTVANTMDKTNRKLDILNIEVIRKIRLRQNALRLNQPLVSTNEETDAPIE